MPQINEFSWNMNFLLFLFMFILMYMNFFLLMFKSLNNFFMVFSKYSFLI